MPPRARESPADDHADSHALWEDTPVTLCIAAACTHNKQPRVVLCTDWKEETALGNISLGSSQNADKLYWVKKGWAALVAGNETRARELVRAYTKQMRRNRRVNEYGNAPEELKKPPQAQKQKLIDEYLRRDFGIAFEWFLDKGKEKLPPETVRECLATIKRINLGASMILSGFVNAAFNPNTRQTSPYALIFHVQMDGSTGVARDFAAIGEGKTIAIPALLQREQDREMGLLETIYHVWEAKKLSQIIPSVGDDTSVDILEPGKAWSLSDSGYDYMETLYGKFGPRDTSPRHIKGKKVERKEFKFNKSYFTSFDFSD